MREVRGVGVEETFNFLKISFAKAFQKKFFPVKKKKSLNRAVTSKNSFVRSLLIIIKVQK